jgi:hypothetical protein
MARLTILLAASSLFVVACALPDLPVPIDGGSDSSTLAEGAASAVESGIGEQPDGDATDATAMAATDATDATDAAMVAVGPDSPTCTNACTLGATACAVGVVQTCQAQANGCTQWVTTETCGMHQTCVGAGTDAGAASCTCTSSACMQIGTLCQDAQTLATCAKDSDGCFYVASNSSCTMPMSCSGMAPSAACSLTCTNSCTSGQTACISGGVATCALGSSGCYSYGAPVACGTHQSCTGTAGAAACTCNTDPVCSVVGNTCANATTLATCTKDAQNCVYASTSTTCPCSAGACCANDYGTACKSTYGCNSGMYQCNGSCNAAADPSNVGTTCHSLGGCNTGMYQCDGSCNAAADPPNLGGQCSNGYGACLVYGKVTCAGCNAVQGTAVQGWQTSPAPNGSWDWNCNNMIIEEYTTCSCPSENADISCEGFASTPPACGQTGAAVGCGYAGDQPPPMCFCDDLPDLTQGCQ